jgi:outer membrane protein assembly factor BamB
MPSRLRARTSALSLLMLAAGWPAEAARSKPPGTLAWQSRFHGGADTTARIAVLGTSAFVAGRGAANASAESGWLVRAYGAQKGNTLWQDAIAGSENKALCVAAQGGLVYAGGFLDNADDTADDAVVRAYDAKKGALRWESRFGLGGAFATVDEIVVAGNRLFAVGRAEHGGTLSTNDWTVLALDARTGALLWQDIDDQGPFDEARSVTALGGRIFASGVTTDSTLASRRFTVRAYDAASGALLWEDRVPGGNQTSMGGDTADQVVAEGDRVVAVGLVSDAQRFHMAVRAYDPQSGTLLWSDLVSSGGDVDVGRAAALRGGRVFAAGIGGAACLFGSGSNCDWLLRAYDAADGTLLWQQQVDAEGGDADQPNVVLAAGKKIVVAGSAGTSPTEQVADWLVQVYDTADGSLAWENLLPTPDTYAFPTGLALSGTRVLVSGSTLDLVGRTQDGDWIVRAHELGPH